MGVVIAVVVTLVIIGALVFGVRTWRAVPPVTPDALPVERSGARAMITLDVAGADPGSPAVRRMVDDLAVHAFAAMHDVDEVEVRDPAGTVLGVRQRVTPVPGPVPDLPRQLLEPHHDPRHNPLVREDEGPSHAHPQFVSGDKPARPLAERFELPAGLRERLRDRDDPVELVAAILALSGQPVTVDGDVVRRGTDVVIVLRNQLGTPVPAEDLNHAFRVFEKTGSRRAVVVTAGHLDRASVRRRELMAPNVVHAGADGIQRMADAAALGADPLRFVAPVQLAVPR